MAVITREISLDVSKSNEFQAIIAKQYDAYSRFLKVTITDSGTKLSIPSNSQVLMNSRRPDGATDRCLGTVNADGTVTFPLTAWMLELDGQVVCDISVIEPNSIIIKNEDGEEEAASSKLTTTIFTLNVEASSYSPDYIPIPATEDLLLELIAAVSQTEAGIEAAETARVEAEATRVGAESIRADGEVMRINTEAVRNRDESGRKNSENTRAYAESQRITAETLRSTAETAREQAEALRQTNTATAVQNANTAREAALAAADEMSIENEDDNKNYTYKFFVRDGHFGITTTEI